MNAPPVCTNGIAPASTEVRPSPWLAILLSIVIAVIGFAVSWGTFSSDVRNLERRASMTEAEVGRAITSQASTAAELARLGARLEAMDREQERLARTIERLTAPPPSPARR